MDAQEFKSVLLLKRPRYANSRKPVFEALANKGNRKSEFSQFGPLYELYAYAFTLGLKIKTRLPLPPREATSDFLEIGKWKRDSTLVDFLLMIVFSNCQEIGFDWNELEDMEEADLQKTLSNIVTYIEEYANGGLEFIHREFKENKLPNSHYLFADLLAEHTSFRDNAEEERERLIIEDPNSDIVESTRILIRKGENTDTEFKSTLRVNLFTKKPDSEMEMGCLKTIAGFMNSKGGTLMIGISDSKEVLGLENDFVSFSKPDKMDEFQKHLDNLIEKYLGNAAYSSVRLVFPEIEEMVICRVDVKPKKSGPTWLKNKGKNNEEEFYIRRAASTIKLKPSEVIRYQEDHWN